MGLSAHPPSPRSELILASTSRYRIELMDRLGVTYRAVAHGCDERAVEGAVPREPATAHEGARGYDERIALTLAMAKAESLAAAHPDAFVLGSDQVVSLDGKIFGKPGGHEGARAQLARLSGREHRIVTAVSLRAPDGVHRSHVDVHRMRMRTLTPDAIARYVERDRPFDCAGSYRIEALGIALFERIEGADHTAIMGLPLTAVVPLLIGVGFAIP